MKNDRRRLLSKEQLLNLGRELGDGVLLLLGAGDIDALVEPLAGAYRKAEANE
jgi:UDP-N-acetylmuramate--alanine ligase